MRSETEMYTLILDFARQREDIRAVVMNGSRVNPNTAPDPFQDYDIVYVVRDVEPYRRNPDLPAQFGELMILQTPDDMGDPPPEPNGGYCYLMQFQDGTRIDMNFATVQEAHRFVEDSLSRILLDKEGLFGTIPPPDERSYLPGKPTRKEFDDCCNEFWWLNPYVAKGLWRGELTYAHTMLDSYMRKMLMKILTWYFGFSTGFVKSPGKFGKYLRSGIGETMWGKLEQTYADADPARTWDALFAMDDLFRLAALQVAVEFGFVYPGGDDQRVSTYIRRIRELPADASSI